MPQNRDYQQESSVQGENGPVLDESSGRWLAGSHALIGRLFSEWLSPREGVCQHVAASELERAAGCQTTGKAGDLHGAVG